uniref:NADH-ubiquinone oxidoreductase chain 2 n=1 Tax=Sisyra aurorae TaxID=2835442 RepID=A0A8F0WHM9_9NEOP|nr:NADH dehydrogenase subunit 2 [Sisyra aurorae]
MNKNLSMIICYILLISGTLLSISSNTWLGAWMGLEMNLLAFIPIINNSKNTMFTEASLKYFLVQALASSILLFSILTQFININTEFYFFTETPIIILMISSLLMKVGAAPMHFWFPSVIEGMNWNNSLILLIWQKIAPMMLISYMINIKFLMVIIMITTFIGAIGGFNQNSMRKILAYSSINHMGWMFSGMMISNYYWMMYFIIYSIISISIIFLLKMFNIFYMNQTFLMMNSFPILKFVIFSNLLSLGGLPPFLGFLPKWMIIQNLINKNLWIIMFMMMMTLITLFYYIRITYSAFMMNYNELKWNMLNKQFLPMKIIFMNFLTLIGLNIIFIMYEFI